MDGKKRPSEAVMEVAGADRGSAFRLVSIVWEYGEAGEAWPCAEGTVEQRSGQQWQGGEQRRDHAKGDEKRRCVALGDMAEAERVFALRLAGLITEAPAGAA